MLEDTDIAGIVLKGSVAWMHITHQWVSAFVTHYWFSMYYSSRDIWSVTAILNFLLFSMFLDLRNNLKSSG